MPGALKTYSELDFGSWNMRTIFLRRREDGESRAMHEPVDPIEGMALLLGRTRLGTWKPHEGSCISIA